MKLGWRLWQLQCLRRYYYLRCDVPLLAPLRACWQATELSAGQLVGQTEFMVVDCEMSSLDAKQGELLSVGWVVIKQGCIDLQSAAHLLVKNKNGVGQSATIHQLLDSDLAEADHHSAMLEQFLAAAAGRVLVFHHAALDMAYLDQLCIAEYGAPLLMPVVDTLKLEQARLTQQGEPVPDGALRLPDCRKRQGLPDYRAHNALSDALATAELLLAQLAHKGSNIRLKELL